MRRVCLLFLLATPPGAAQQPHPFLDAPNVTAFAADFSARSLDAWSTRRNLERGAVELYQPSWVYSRDRNEYAYSIGVAAAITGAAYLLHRRNHHLLERMLPAVDAAYDGSLAINNLRCCH